MTDVMDFLNSSDFVKHPTAKFRNIGDKVVGPIVGPPVVARVPKFDNPSETEEKVTFPIDTGEPYVPENPNDPDDAALAGDTIRTVWVNKGRMASAISQAVKAAGVKQLEEGGKIAIQYVGDGVPKEKRFNPPKEYAAKYEPPTAGINADDLLGF